MEGPGDEDDSRHKKDKKDREPKRVEEEKKDKKLKPKKEEVEEKYKSSNKVEASKKVEEEKAALCKMAEDEKHRSTKDDRPRSSREEDDDAPKYSKRAEAEKYKYGREEDFRHRYRQDEDRSRSSRGEERPRYNDDRYRSNRYPESRSKYDRDREEPKAKVEKETKTVKRQFKEEAEVKKPEPPPKPYDPPKVMCGPSPAMRAKLRKQSLESAKAAAPVALSPPAAAFGRFTWKRKENVLAKEAERVAAEFLKDDEAPPGDKIPVEDSFAKSMAVAKEIALKLSGQPTLPPPWAGQVARGRIRPNLPAPAVGPRKTTVVSKAIPLNAFPSVTPQTSEAAGPVDDPPASQPIPMEIDNQDEPIPEPAHVPAKLPVQMPLQIPPQIPLQMPPQMPVEAPPQFPPPAMSENQRLVAVESDEAAPGVPASEQTRTVFVKPPPFMNTGDGAHRSEKLKTHLAAAKAKDLFDIFYSGVSQTGPSAFTKTATASGTKTSEDKMKVLQPVPQSQPKPVPSPPVLLKTTPVPSKPQTADQSGVKLLAQSEKTNPTPAPQPHPLVLSQSTPPRQTQQPVQSKKGPPMDTAEVKTAPQPELNSPTQSQVQSVPHIQQDPVPQSNPHVPAVPQSKPHVPPVPQSNPQVPPVSQTKPQVPAVSQTEPQIQLVPQTQLDPIPLTQSQVPAVSQTQPVQIPEPQTLFAADTKVDPPQVGQMDPLPCLHSQDLDLELTTAPPTECESLKTPKGKTKTSPQAKKTSPVSRPVRRTRSQTRYQTRQQRSRSESESESKYVLEHEDADEAETGPSLEALVDPQTEEMLLPSDDPPNPETPDIMTPETLGLPPDMMSLGFEYDFNFE